MDKIKWCLKQKNGLELVEPNEELAKAYIKKAEDSLRYNQIANYVYMQSEINIKIGNKSPKSYFTELLEQFNGGEVKYGGINEKSELQQNLKMNCVPESIFNMEIGDYENFLKERRKLIAKKIKEYYFSL